MDELVKKLVDGVMDEMDDIVTGYIGEYGGLGSEKEYKREIRRELEIRIRDILKES